MSCRPINQLNSSSSEKKIIYIYNKFPNDINAHYSYKQADLYIQQYQRFGERSKAPTTPGRSVVRRSKLLAAIAVVDSSIWIPNPVMYLRVFG